MGVKAIIAMPRTTPIAKVLATQNYGAEVVLYGDCYDEAYQHALDIQQERGAVFIHPFDDEDVIAGQGTISLEILCDLPTVDAVLVPAGGGGLLAGMAACIKQINPRVAVIGVQASKADAIVKHFHTGQHEVYSQVATIADGIAVKCPGEITLPIIQKYVDDMVTVTDNEIAESILLLLERNKMVVEPAGAAALAAVLNHKVKLKGKRTACVLSGGNIDVGFIHKIVEKGLITRGRQMKFSTVMKDVPGSLKKFSEIIADCGANIIMVQHDRLRTDLQLGEAILHVACEVTSREHGFEIMEKLAQNGYMATLES
jgi:threonine dehydratase